MNGNNDWFSGKVALVTGSTMGIGKTLAIQLCRNGAKVMINGRNADRLAATLNEMKNLGFDVASCKADVTVYDDCERLIQNTIESFGKLDILVNNAGIVGYSSFESFDPAEFRKALDSNIYGAVFPTKAAISLIKESKGSIVFVSSLAGLMGLPDYSAYSAGKMSLTAFSESLRMEMADSGVHIGIVHVGFTRNEEEKRFLSADGSLIPVPVRNASLVQPREKVAGSIMKLIRRRKSKMVLSPFGKLTAFIIRFIPVLARAIVSKNR